MNTSPNVARNDTDLTEKLLAEIETLAGPRFRRLEERADGRDLLDMYDLLDHTDMLVSHDNITQMAATVIRERTTWLATLRAEGEFEEFAAHYMEAR